MAEPTVTLVVPAYNEARRLPDTLAGWIGYLDQQPYDAELIVVDDGSRDDTAQVVRTYAQRQPRVRLVQLPANRGKGAAVRAGMLEAAGRYVFYVDADLNVAPAHLGRALQLFEARRCDVVLGSRSLSDYAAQERSPARLVAGGLVQVARRSLVLPVIRDTQCGFKGFRREVARTLFARTRIDSFAFDIEVLFLARKLGFYLVEMPVETTFRAESTFDVSRHLGPFLADIVRIRRNDVQGRYG
jgi:glycosyltransferase involved in cell wall biosynthesis